MDCMGVCRRTPWPQLQLHQQLARRIPRGQRSDRTVGRLVGAVAHRTCSAVPASCSRYMAAGARRSAGTAPRHRRCRSASPARWRSPARNAPRSGSSRSFRCCSWPRRCWGPPSSTTAPICPGSSAWIWRAILPYNLARTWHLQLALFWTAAAFLAGGIFLTPFIARREPRRQHWLAYGLLGAVALVVVGSLLTEALSIYGVVPSGSLFSQQWEYLDLPRLWQILLIVGMFLWIASSIAGCDPGWQRVQAEHALVVLLSGSGDSGVLRRRSARQQRHPFSVADFWRFWVVHLWVEDFLELFTTVMVAYIFVMLGVVRERIALGVIFLDIILYSAGGVIGTMHHLYFSGTPVEHMASVRSSPPPR